MNIQITEVGSDSLAEYGKISIAYDVIEELDPDSPSDLGSVLPMNTRQTAIQIVKDYDALPGNRPVDWAARFDVAEWGVLAAHVDGLHVGGAVVVDDASGVDMLEGRDDLAVLWDIRVAPATRGHDVGTALLSAAEAWACARGCNEMKVETQNINVPACRFYARHGFRLGMVSRSAYRELPGEIQLLWYKGLTLTTDS